MREEETQQLRPVSPASSVRVVMTALVLLLIGAAVLFTLRRPPDPIATPLTEVERGTVIHQVVVVGRVVPRTEVQVKATIPGVLSRVVVQPGESVQRGQLLATIRPVADPVSLSDARARVEQAALQKQAAARELERQRKLQLGAAVDLDLARDALRVAEVELAAAKQAVRLIAEGTSQGRGQASTHVLSPLDGTVLAVPVVVGSFVSDTNPYRDGTTIAVVAEMGAILLKGQMDESRIAELKLGMPLSVQEGARAQERFDATLEYIAPQATIEHTGVGTAATAATKDLPGRVTRFEIWAAVPADVVGELRAGYSATAEIELGRCEDVLVVNEGALTFRDGRPHVMVHGPERKISEREIEVGISDGIRIEVVSGLDLGERVALQIALE